MCRARRIFAWINYGIGDWKAPVLARLGLHGCFSESTVRAELILHVLHLGFEFQKLGAKGSFGGIVCCRTRRGSRGRCGRWHRCRCWSWGRRGARWSRIYIGSARGFCCILVVGLGCSCGDVHVGILCVTGRYLKAAAADMADRGEKWVRISHRG